MRVLLLGSSDDDGDWFEGGRKKHEIVAERLIEELGEPVEFVVKSIWPTAELPRVVAGWMAKYEPDVVYLNTGAYWFLYRSVPLRMKRLFGRLGETAGGAGFAIADSKRWSHNALFRAVRVALQRTVGGDTNFTADEVLARISETLLVVVREEGAAVVMKGPIGKRIYPGSKRRQAADEAKRLRVHLAFEALCAQHHVAYDGTIEHVRHNRAAYGRGTTVGDGLHGNEKRHQHEADRLHAGIIMALETGGYPAARVANKPA